VLEYPYSPVDDMTVGDALIPASTVVVVTRRDGVAMEAGDLTASSTLTTTTPKPSGAITSSTAIPLVIPYLGQGVAGRTYKVTIRTSTQNGNVFEDDFYVKVRDR
jgi:hypothetical protein